MEPLSRSSGSRAAESIGENGPETGEDVPEHFKDTSKSVLKDLEGDLAETERGNLGDSLPLPTASAYPRHGFRKSMIASAINTRLEVIRTEVNPLSEISGSLGDLGTLLPIIVALSKKSQINLSAALLFGGIYNILTGIYVGRVILGLFLVLARSRLTVPRFHPSSSTSQSRCNQ